MDIDRQAIILSLFDLKATYRWEQFGCLPADRSEKLKNPFCKPCGIKLILNECQCCTNIEISESDESPIAMKLIGKKERSAIKRVIVDSESDDMTPHPISANSQTECSSTENSPFLKVPASARSKNVRHIISDSESEDESPTAANSAVDRPIRSKLFPSRRHEDEIKASKLSALDRLSIDDSSTSLSDESEADAIDEEDNDWIVNDSDVENDQHSAGFYSDEETDGWNFDEESEQQENVRPSKKNVYIDLTQSPDYPLKGSKGKKALTTSKTKGILSGTISCTPTRGKGKNSHFTPGTVTPSRKLCRTEVNQQRVEALSTGKKKFKGTCSDQAIQLYHLYNEVIFDNQLPADMSVTWNKRLLTTAGYCRMRPRFVNGEMQRIVSIELSNKVVDTDERLRSTLIHEMCHAANILIDKLDNEMHGKAFKHWGRKASKQFPEISVTTCHSYSVHMPHKFKCTKTDCGLEYSRHTKKGLNTDKQFCGMCRSRIEYIGTANKEGVIAKPRQASGFSAYVKDHFAHTKASLAVGTSTAEVMRALAAQYKAEKTSSSSVAAVSMKAGGSALQSSSSSSDCADNVESAAQEEGDEEGGAAVEVYLLRDSSSSSEEEREVGEEEDDHARHEDASSTLQVEQLMVGLTI